MLFCFVLFCFQRKNDSIAFLFLLAATVANIAVTVLIRVHRRDRDKHRSIVWLLGSQMFPKHLENANGQLLRKKKHPPVKEIGWVRDRKWTQYKSCP